MADELTQDIKGLTTSFREIDRLVKSITDNMKTMSQSMRGASRTGLTGNAGGFGQKNLGNSGSGMMPNSLGNVPDILASSRMFGLGGSILQGSITAATGLIGGAFMGLPDWAKTTTRSSGFYSAALLSGTSRNRVSTGTFSALAGGMTSAGSDAAVAANLADMGIMYNQGRNSQYQVLARSTANAARYLNIDNEAAAQALGGLTTGGTSSSLLRNFGIFTTDPRTGKRYSPTQIFAQLNQRMTQGRKLTREELMSSYQGGALGFNLRNSGLDETQQRLAFQYMLDASEGEPMDLGDEKIMARLRKKAGVNPMQSIYDVNTSQTGSMQAASDSYITGMQKAAKAVQLFEGAITNFLNSPAGKVMAQINAGVGLASQDQAVKGGLTAAGGLLGGAMQVGGGILAYKGLKGLMGKLGVSGGSAVQGAKGLGLLGSLGKSLGKAGGIAGLLFGGLGALNGYLSGNKKEMNSGIGTVLGGGAGMAAAALLAPASGGLSLLLPIIGSMLGGAIGGNVGGDQSTVATGGITDTTGTLKLIAPVRGNITLGFNAKDEHHPNGHKGIDYGVGEGTPVQAAADGTIKSVGIDKTYGTMVLIDHGDGYETLYGHLSSSNAVPGRSVKQGEVIAFSGNTGYSTGPHLHFGVLKNGAPINPSNLGIGGSVAIVAGSLGAGSSSTAQYQTAGASSVSGSTLGYSTSYSSISAAAVPSSYRGASIASSAGGYRVSASGLGHGSTQPGSPSATGGTGGGLDPMLCGKNNNVVINLSIAQATESEARKFAQLVKTYLEDEKMLSSMGRM